MPGQRPTRRPKTASAVPASSAEPARVLAKALGRSAELLGLNGAALARTIGLSESTVSRLLSGERALDPDSKAGELALLLIRVYRSLDAMVGNDAQLRRAWFESPNRALNGVPRRLVERAEGLVAVLAYLDAMRAPL